MFRWGKLTAKFVGMVELIHGCRMLVGDQFQVPSCETGISSSFALLRGGRRLEGVSPHLF